ncbi:MAG: hypothetical protein II494_01315, partial [Bacilli bacterium]|nr:hypothetical protein [Bacilli bacterium]
SSTFLIACGNPAGQNPVSSIVANSSAETPISSARDNHDSVSSLIESSSSSAVISSSVPSSSPTPTSSSSSSSSSQPVSDVRYFRIMDVEELDLDKPIVIAANNNGSLVTLSTDQYSGTATKLTGKAATMDGNSIVKDSNVTEWTLEQNGSYYTFSNGNTYLQSYTSKSNGKTYYNIKVANDSRNSNNWNITIDDGVATLKSDKNVYVEWYKGCFQGYSNGGDVEIYLYQEHTSGPAKTWTWDTNYQAANQYVPTAINENVNYYELDQNTNTIGTSKVLVIPIAFTDETFTSGELQDIQTVLGGSAEDTNYWESLKSFYYKSSYGQLNLEFTYSDPVNMGVSASEFYSANGQDGSDIALRTGVAAYKTAHGETSTAEFDQNNDGVIDSVIMIYACDQLSHGDYDGDLYWAYRYWDSGIDETQVSVESPIGYSYFWASMNFFYEGTGTRANHTGVDAHTMCHEFGHMLGADDYYNAGDKSGKEPSGSKLMMAFNVLDHDIFNKMSFGWVKPIVATGSTEVTLTSSALSGSALLLADPNGWNGTAFDEYVLLELYTPEGLNEQDSVTAYPGRTDAFGSSTGLNQTGIRAWHVDNRLCFATETSESGAYIGNEVTDQQIISGNLPTGEGEFVPLCSNSAAYDAQSIQGKGYDSLTMISSTGKAWTSSNYAVESDLFQSGDTFSLMDSADATKYKKYFANRTKMNNGNTFPWKVTVKSISNGQAVLDVAYGEMK